MTKRPLLLLLFSLSGCDLSALSSTDAGPETRPIAIEVVNHYADSLFSVAVEVPADGGGTESLFSDERIDGYKSKKTRQFEVMPGQPVRVFFSAMSLGKRNSFDPLTITKEAGKDTFTITYDYDLATANFVIRHAWGL